MRTMKRSMLLIAMLAGLTGGGCTSSRITMTPPVKRAVVPDNNYTFYKVEKVTLAFASYDFFGLPQSTLPSDWKGEGFAKQFTSMAEERYPGLFKTSNAAIPIAVRIDVTEKVHDGVALLMFMGTLGVLGGVFPSVPWTNEWQVIIHAEDARGAPILSTRVQAERRGWWSFFTPCGLITIPGESDAPKVSTVGGGPIITPPAHRTYVTECMVDLLVAELLKQDPTMLPARSAAPDVSSALPTPPAILPPPTESAAPF